MSARKSIDMLLTVGGYICLLIGLYAAFGLAKICSTVQISSGGDVAALFVGMAFTLLAFFPFVAFVLLKSAALHKSVFMGAAIAEVLVFSMVIWLIWYPRF